MRKLFYHTDVRCLGFDEETGDEIPLRVQLNLVVVDDQGLTDHVIPLYEYLQEATWDDGIFC